MIILSTKVGKEAVHAVRSKDRKKVTALINRIIYNHGLELDFVSHHLARGEKWL